MGAGDVATVRGVIRKDVGGIIKELTAGNSVDIFREHVILVKSERGKKKNPGTFSIYKTLA